MKKLIITIAILLTAGVCSADNYVGGMQLTTIKDGTVSGGVYFDSYYGAVGQVVGNNTITKTFTIPDLTDVEWAMLLTTVYCGNMQDNKPLTANTTFNDIVLGNETLNVTFNYIIYGGNDNTGQGGGSNDPYKMVNDHVNRVTSDYMIWYNVTDLVHTGENSATVHTEMLSGGLDGRLKLITLIAAYNDGSIKKIHYWINRGHDVDTYYRDEPLPPDPPTYNDYIGSTNFVANINGAIQDANLTAVHMASTDGNYTFNSNSIPSGTLQGSYCGSNTWNVTGSFIPGGTNNMTYDRSGEFYKMALGILTARYQEPDLLPTAIKPYHYVWTGIAPWNDPFFNLTNYVNVTVMNNGSGDAGSFKVRLYADDELIQEKIISGLSSGSTTEEIFEWKPIGEDPLSWVDTPDGSKITCTTTDRTYTLKAAVDEANEVPEGNETNNNLTRSDSRTKAVWNGYTGDQPLQNYIKGSVKGGMLYTTGDGAYQARLNNGTAYGTYYNVTYDLEIPGTPVLSRLYYYYTWGESPALAPKIGVTLTTPSGTHTLSMDKGYNDYKGEFGINRHPWGTYAYNITEYVTAGGTYHVNITNLNNGSDAEFATVYAFAAPAILVVYEDTSMPSRKYWINEGADVLLGGRKDNGGYLAWWEAINNATFPGSVSLNNATLGIVSPWADSVADDEVYFNGNSLGRGTTCGYNDACTQEKDGLKMVVGSGAQVSINASDVTAYLVTSDNRLAQADDGDCMMPANAFLLVEYATMPAAPFLIEGWVNCTTGEAVNGPSVTVTNLNTSEVFIAETDAGSNYYKVVTSSDNVRAGDVLHFTVSNSNSVEFDHTVTQAEMDAGGFVQNAAIDCGGSTFTCGDVDGIPGVTVNDGRQIFMNILYGSAQYPLSSTPAADCDGLCDGITVNDGRQIFMNILYGTGQYPLDCNCPSP